MEEEARGRVCREVAVGLVFVGDDDFDAFAVVAAAFPDLVCFSEPAGLFIFVVVAALPPRQVEGAFLLLVCFFEADAIGGDADVVVFFFFETGFAFVAPVAAAALPDERVLRAIVGRRKREKGGGSRETRELVSSLQSFFDLKG